MARLTDVRGRVALVTGASSGIGLALARELARRGARVGLVARRRTRLEQIAAEIAAAGGEASIHVCDVGERDQVERTVAEAALRWKRLDLLVNNAGAAPHILFQDHDVADIERTMRINYLGAVYLMKSALPHLRAGDGGFVVNLSSFAGQVGQPDEAAYSASKAAVRALSQALVHELAPLGVHVLCVHPVLVRTEMFTPEVLARMPRRSRRSFIAPEAFARQTLASLARGDCEVTIPRRYRWVPILREIFPRTIGRIMGRVKLAALSDAPSPRP